MATLSCCRRDRMNKTFDIFMYSLAFLVGLAIAVSLVGSLILGSMLYLSVSALLLVVGIFSDDQE
jgi:hypothetical protein